MNSNIYRDISERTGGDIYIGVVGPVRTGKSTFVSRFMQMLVVPNIEDENERKRTIDELPQSADGTTVMTTQPKFVPGNAVKIAIGENVTCNVRMVDCVGHIVQGADGYMQGDKARLVNTPWSAEPMPFEQAAELGTKKVATEHSTICIAITTDGTIGQLPRGSYVAAEEQTVAELKAAGKPFVLLLNTTSPTSEDAIGLSKVLEQKYGVVVLPFNVLSATEEQFLRVLNSVLMQFPARRIVLDLPQWMRVLPADNYVIAELTEKLKGSTEAVSTMQDAQTVVDMLAGCTFIDDVAVADLNLGNGTITISAVPKNGLFYEILSAEADTEISDEFSLMSFVSECSVLRKRLGGMSEALEQADKFGYGIVMPQMENMTLDEPQMVHKGSIYGVKLTATAPSYHIIRVDVSTEVSPMVGSEQQSAYLLAEYKQNPEAIWNANMFGKTMSGLATEGLAGKCNNMPEEIKQKLSKTVNRIVNENRGSLLCFIL